MDKSLEEKSDRQTERMLHALRERHRLLAQCERPVGMAKVRVTLGRLPKGHGATVISHRVRQRHVCAGIIESAALLEMAQRPQEVALVEEREGDLVVSARRSNASPVRSAAAKACCASSAAVASSALME